MKITPDLIDNALLACATTHTRRNYNRALRALSAWLDGRELSYAVLTEYRAHLVARRQSPQNINQQLAATRFFLREMGHRGHIEPDAAEAIGGVKNLKIKGRKLGNWLNTQQAKAFLDAPDLSTPIGYRDRAILGLLIGGGLRRSEVCSLEPRHFERRSVPSDSGPKERWVIVGVQGKHGRTRNIPIADWIKALVDAWLDRAGITSGPIIRAAWWSEAKRKLTISPNPMTPSALFYLAQKYGKRLALASVAPHDLRRTFARLAHEGKADMKQIQLALGHADMKTTEIYVNAQQDLQNAPSDVLGVEVEA